ncbi:hypothetical protein [Chitinophaga sp. CF418]|uniref:hypothetical protein n=1 Tax=Chitinophaga sp. CF418 TaxID=1855287 RepID=UPI000911AA8D|nr:hypothetical protein [Chitinophaga sp. CF418]SHN16344.1 hypothetical protein SAMN05216311_10662 [Chitinophaga sp. CF418]
MYRLLFIITFFSFNAMAQTTVPFDSPRWKITGQEAVKEAHLGQPSLKLKSGSALLADANFKNGIIEFDIALSKARYFPGIDFRIQDDSNFEEYYLRPHQSGNPDAMQYTPVYNRDGGFQLYYGTGYNNAVVLPFDRWLHIKMVVKEKEAEIYFDNGAEPVLYINPLDRIPTAGMISLANPWDAVAWYSNFVYTSTDAVTIKSSRQFPKLPEGTITSWDVSTVFSEKQVDGRTKLQAADTASLRWKTLWADHNGITNVSVLSAVTEEKNTVFVRKVIDAGSPRIRKLNFGFSDKARVYLNGRLLYEGNDEFLTRDYRFLGTVGYWDALYLPLEKGRNELLIAISEAFGGWGIKAQLTD